MPKLQSKAYKAFRYFSGNFALRACSTLVGDPGPIFTTGGRLSGKAGSNFPFPVRHPNSDPLVTWQIRVGRYQGRPKSHSISRSEERRVGKECVSTCISR